MAALLPIVGRELRVAARKRSSFWVRIVAALVAFALGTGFLIVQHVGAGLAPASLGAGLFRTLTWLCLAVCLAAGLFLTSDCLSEEKRAGTLGLLFLTDLRGYDVVLGKLLASSLRGVCAVLGVLPILAVTLLIGGVTGTQFWQTSLALLNALFLSLAAGLLVSALCQESQKALSGTLFLLIGVVLLGPISDEILASTRMAGARPLLSLSSPGYLFMRAGLGGTKPFCLALLVNQTVAWSLLVLAGLLLPRTWQEKAGTSATTRSLGYRWRFGGGRRRARLRARLMDINPVLWLACRERWQAVSVWIISLAIVSLAVAVIIEQSSISWVWMAWGQATGALVMLLYLGFASQSARFFVEGRRSGAMELLLVSPLTITQIIQGQWRALGRMLGLPLALFLAAECAGGFAAQNRAWKQMAGSLSAMTASATNAPPVTPAGSNNTRVTIKSGTLSGVTFSGPRFTLPPRSILLGMAVASTCSLLANFVALVWVGMWMGLTSKTLNLATLKTIIFVQIIPWFALSFASAILVPILLIPTFIRGGSVGPQFMMLFPWLASGLATVFALGKDLAFSLWARKKLHREFRERVLQVLAGTPPLQPPLVSAARPPTGP